MYRVLVMKQIISFFLLQISATLWSNAEPLIEISQGLLNGTIQESANGRKYSAFLGIPYAKPPIGNLRFKNPQPADKWNGIRLANSFGNHCPQIPEELLVGNEDCLFLNVYTPFLDFNSSTVEKKINNTLLPVMVFVHGGGFIYGSSIEYSANNLLDKDIILVTMNYRVGIFGFFSTGTVEAPGNFGLKDQVLSLKWVQENIQSFGGNPNKVTLFGQSAGGASVGYHAISKASNGLFQQYIIQSGNPIATWAYRNRNDFIQFTRKVSSIVSCPLNNTESFVACLRQKSVQTLLKISTHIIEFMEPEKFWWKPTSEPEAEGAFLTDSPKNLLNQNQMKDLPFMIGDVTDEGTPTTILFYGNSSFYNFVRSNLDQFIIYSADSYLDNTNKTQFVAAVKEFYFNNTIDTLGKNEFIEKLTDFLDDVYYHYPDITTLEKAVSKMRNLAYFYLFSYCGEKSLYPSIDQYRKNGAGHGEELLYLLLGPQTTDLDIHMRKLMVDLWTSFATNGKPTSNILENPDIWVPYDTKKKIHFQIGNVCNYSDPSVKLYDEFYKNRINFWRRNTHI